MPAYSYGSMAGRRKKHNNYLGNAVAPDVVIGTFTGEGIPPMTVTAHKLDFKKPKYRLRALLQDMALEFELDDETKPRYHFEGRRRVDGINPNGGRW